ncbi:ABC transporter permease [Rhizobium sp. Leaf262]|uniref:ABC transporter permease n=1 Tax=Rhizobium sp. Leaf262 TaxID=1736312 RepID=UPI0007141110|nr:ABC transporter permease [Rhizobium sp. Leaf262]KQO83483.1 diguanylate cyclase [Rhizobium sp. Leaf262]
MTNIATATPPRRRLIQSRVLRRFMAHRLALIGAIIVLLFAIMAIAAPLIAPYEPNASSWSAIRKAPTWLHWFGTDELGRDVMSRVIWGARASLLAGVVSVAIAFVIGVPIGMLAGYFGGPLDTVIMRIIDAFLAIPFLILAIAMAAFLGPSLTNAMIAIGVSTAPVFARIARGQTMAVKVEEYIEAAHAIGTGHVAILIRHVFINITPQLVVQSTLAIATAIIAEAALAFLGLGQQPPDASWGSMLNSASSSLSIAPWIAIWPGLAIFLTVLGFNLLGDGLQDALDVKG